VARRERDLERFLTFIDAVVAIAITLLVLPLAEAGSEINQDETVAEVLREHVVDIFGFLLSFAVISRSGSLSTRSSAAWPARLRPWSTCCSRGR
jgi:uncharacterized membrane protein